MGLNTFSGLSTTTGLSQASALSQSGGLSASSSASTTPTYLPIVQSASQIAVYCASSNEVVGYSGPIIRIVQPSNQARTLDIYASTSTGLLDVSGVAAFLGSDTYGEIDIVYDQLGSGNNKTQTTQANRPWLLLENAVSGMYSISHQAAIPASLTRLVMPNAITASGRSFSQLRITKMKSTNNGAVGTVGLNTFTAGNVGLYLGNNGTAALGYKSAAIVTTAGGSLTATSSRSRSQPQVTTIVCSGTNTKLYQDNTTYTLGLNTAGTWAGGHDGTIDTTVKYAGEVYLDVIYGGILNSTDVATLHSYCYGKWPILTNANAQLIWPGTSVVEGIRMYGLHNMQYYLEPVLSRSIEIYNMGVAGQTVATMNANSAYYTGMFRNDRTYNLAIGGEPSNDINNLPTGGIVGQAAVIWSTATLPFIQALKGAGFTVAVPTTPPLLFSGSVTDQNQKETERVAHNVLVRDNNVAQGYTVLDYAAVPQAQDKTNFTYFYTDQVHWTQALYAILAPQVLAPWVNANI